MATQYNQLPEVGFLKLHQIIGNKKTNTPAILPVSRTTFLSGVKSGKYPKPVKLGERSVAWRLSDIKELLERLGSGNHQNQGGAK